MKTRVRVTPDTELTRCLDAFRKNGIDPNKVLTDRLKKLKTRKGVKKLSGVGVQ